MTASRSLVDGVNFTKLDQSQFMAACKIINVNIRKSISDCLLIINDDDNDDDIFDIID